MLSTFSVPSSIKKNSEKAVCKQQFLRGVFKRFLHLFHVKKKGNKIRMKLMQREPSNMCILVVNTK